MLVPFLNQLGVLSFFSFRGIQQTQQTGVRTLATHLRVRRTELEATRWSTRARGVFQVPPELGRSDHLSNVGEHMVNEEGTLNRFHIDFTPKRKKKTRVNNGFHIQT